MQTTQATCVLAYLSRQADAVQLAGSDEVVRRKVEYIRRRAQDIREPESLPDPIAADALVDALYHELGARPPQMSAALREHPLWIARRDPDPDAERDAMDVFLKELEAVPA